MAPTTLHSSVSDNIDLFFLIGTLLVVVFGGFITQYRRKHRAITLANTPVLLAYYTENTSLIPLKTGEIDGLTYTAIATSSLNTLIIRVDLDFSSRVHLLGIPKNPGVDQLDPDSAGSIMERVELEGDYDNYFQLYCENHQQTQVRYILDTAAMAFTIDFCRSHNWEILDNVLYFVQSSPNVAPDNTDMLNDLVPFIDHIKPAVAIPLSKEQLRSRSPYGEEYRQSLNCPVCQDAMSNQQSLFVCPQGDGILLNAAKLYELRNGSITPPAITNGKAPDASRGQLTCPACQNPMVKVPYNGGIFDLDTCTNCHYRWLDSPEVTRIIKPA